MKIFNFLIKELKESFLVSCYFFISFCVILLLKKLFLSQHGIEFYGLPIAFLGALIVGKVVVVLDKTSFGNVFRNSVPFINVVWRSLIYSIMTYAALYAEQIYHYYHESGSLYSAILKRYSQRDLDYFLATSVCIFLSFLAYNIFSEIDRYLGRGQLLKIFFTSKKDADPKTG